MRHNLRLLKLVTGVEISTRPVRRPGSWGKAEKRRSRKAAAELKRRTFRRSSVIIPLVAPQLCCIEEVEGLRRSKVWDEAEAPVSAGGAGSSPILAAAPAQVVGIL